jgi:hypothetical protein
MKGRMKGRIARFYERPMGKRLRNADAEVHRQCPTGVLGRVGQLEGTLATRFAAARAELDAIAVEFAAAQR